MSELFTFKPADKRFEFTVKEDFRQKCSNPETVETYELLTKFKINQFFHNPNGPAITRLKDNYNEYWLDGQKVSEEVGKKIAHNSQFSYKLNELVTDDT